MSLLQIAEPGQSTAPHQHKHAVGIDLGTTNSLVATIRSGQSEVITDENGEAILPSVVRYLGGKEPVIVGKQAANSAELDPENTVISVKRIMGKSIDEINTAEFPYDFAIDNPKVPRINTRSGKKSAIEVSAEILKTLYRRSIEALGEDIEGAVITVPAYFDDAQRQATRDAAHLAGINVLRLLNEPTAAAVAYGLDEKAEGIHVIYDLGGGTFDVSILQFSKGVFEVLATGGDTALGGDDFDRLIAQWAHEHMGFPELSKSGWRSLLDAVRGAKENLSTMDSASIPFSCDGVVWKGKITRHIFSQLVEPLLTRTTRICRKALLDAKVKIEDVEDLVMVGGSTRSPIVRKIVGEFFQCDPLCNIDPDKVVAIGASIQADALIGNRRGKEILLLDVTPLSLGVEIMGGMVEKLIHRNTTIPVSRAQEFTTYKDGQTALSIHVLQGDREMVEDCRSLARFTLKGIPPMVAGAAKIRVQFQVDADGLMSVSAKELTSGVEAHVEVKPSYGLDETEITQMLQDSFENAKGDSEKRALREQQIEGTRLLESVKNALKADGEILLCKRELSDIESKISQLESVVDKTDTVAIKKACEELNLATELFAAKRMDSSIKVALSGRNVDNV